MILYFTGTGNSAFIAKRIAKKREIRLWMCFP